MMSTDSFRRTTPIAIALLSGGLAAAFHFFWLSAPVYAQATFPMKIKRVEELNPRATLKLEGRTVTRTNITKDPGYRIQWHVKKDGKTVAQVNARPDKTYTHPDAAPGKYTVVLELYFPEYKATSKESKGLFKPISNEVAYEIAGAKAEQKKAGDAKKDGGPKQSDGKN